jgi:hypothetical protein
VNEIWSGYLDDLLVYDTPFHNGLRFGSNINRVWFKCLLYIVLYSYVSRVFKSYITKPREKFRQSFLK